MKIACTLGLFLALSPANLTAGGVEPEGQVVSTTLTAIRQNPEAYKNVWVSFTAQFAAIGRVSNPFFTQFVPSEYANLHVWADEQAIWQEEDYRDVFGLMFLSKESELLQSLYKQKVYQRLSFTAVVRNTFQGQPWIEVIGFSEVSGKLNTATLAHIYRGEKYMAERQWTKAISELSLAPAANVPQAVLAEIHKELATCYLRLGESGTAVSHLESAMSMMPEVTRELQQLAQVAQNNPETELDRSVNSVELSDHERPMWEAFEKNPVRAARPQSR